MSQPINTGNFGKALWPGVNSWYGKAYDEYPEQYTDLFDLHTSSRAFEEDVGVTSFGMLAKKNEGGPIQYDSERQAFITRYAWTEYALGFIITKNMYDDDQYMMVGEKRAKGLAFSTRQTIETLAANVYNRAFTSSYAGGDGKELLATDHPNFAGGTWSNEPSTAADISEAALEQACIDIARWTNDRGLKITVIPQSIHIAPEQEFELHRILKTDGRVGTNNNDLNALKSMGKFPKGVKVNHYFTDTDAWFIRTNVTDGLKWWWRRRPDFSQDNDWETENAKYKVVFRAGAGWTDPKALYGSPGA